MYLSDRGLLSLLYGVGEHCHPNTFSTGLLHPTADCMCPCGPEDMYIYSQTEWQYTQWGTIMHNSTVHNGVYTHHTLLRAETTATRFFTLHTCCVLVKCTCIVHVWTIICVQTKEIMVKQMFGAKSVPHDKVGTSSNTHYVCTSYSSEIANENTSKAVNNDSQGYS